MKEYNQLNIGDIVVKERNGTYLEISIIMGVSGIDLVNRLEEYKAKLRNPSTQIQEDKSEYLQAILGFCKLGTLRIGSVEGNIKDNKVLFKYPLEDRTYIASIKKAVQKAPIDVLRMSYDHLYDLGLSHQKFYVVDTVDILEIKEWLLKSTIALKRPNLKYYTIDEARHLITSELSSYFDDYSKILTTDYERVLAKKPCKDIRPMHIYFTRSDKIIACYLHLGDNNWLYVNRLKINPNKDMKKAYRTYIESTKKLLEFSNLVDSLLDKYEVKERNFEVYDLLDNNELHKQIIYEGQKTEKNRLRIEKIKQLSLDNYITIMRLW